MKRRVSFCLCLWSLIGSAVGEIVNVYVAEGQTLTLRPKFKDPVESVEWQRNRNLLAEWAGNEVTRYDNRIALNDEVFAVKVIKFVPEPEVHPTPLACSENLETCTLHCGGDTSGAEPVTYIWRTEPETEMPEVRNRTIDRKTSAVKSFFCIMQNPLGRKESQAFANPFYQDRPGGGLGPGGIAGVVSGTLGALCGVVVAAWFCSKRQRGLALRPSNGATGGTNLETSRPLNSNN
uniref:Uncharacterized LOC109510221 n=1 Tax=Hippocampus comes TaxID=109280 RepID=A0A3Q2YBQ6_HIPCM